MPFENDTMRGVQACVAAATKLLVRELRTSESSAVIIFTAVGNRCVAAATIATIAAGARPVAERTQQSQVLHHSTVPIKLKWVRWVMRWSRGGGQGLYATVVSSLACAAVPGQWVAPATWQQAALLVGTGKIPCLPPALTRSTLRPRWGRCNALTHAFLLHNWAACRSPLPHLRQKDHVPLHSLCLRACQAQLSLRA